MIMISFFFASISLVALKEGYPEALLIWLILPLIAYAEAKGRDFRNISRTEAGSN